MLHSDPARWETQKLGLNKAINMFLEKNIFGLDKTDLKVIPELSPIQLIEFVGNLRLDNL